MHRVPFRGMGLAGLLLLCGCSPDPAAPVPGLGTTRVVLFLTTDLHSRLFPEEPGGGGGLSRIASLIRAERARTEATFFLDAGDLVEGGILYPRFLGVPELAAMEAAGVDARALGNHDSGLLHLGRALVPPFLAANLSSDLGPSVEPLQVLRGGGISVAVIGLGRLGDEPPGLAVAVAAVREGVAVVREQAEVVVLLSHLGSELDGALLEQVSGIDVVLGGHSHDVLPPSTTVLDCGPKAAEELGCRPRAVPLVHAGAYGKYLGRVELLVSTAETDLAAAGGDEGRGVVLQTLVHHVEVRVEVPEDPVVTAALDPYLLKLHAEGAFELLASAPRPVRRYGPGGGDSALGNFVAASVREGTGADLAVIPASALRADLEAGDVSREGLHRALPFEDRLAALMPTGAELAAAFRRFTDRSCAAGATVVHVDGPTVAFDCGEGRATLEFAGSPLDPAATYRVVTTTFLTAEGQALHLPGRAAGDAGGGERLRDRVERALRSLPPCPLTPGGLPCLDGQAGAFVDGRVLYR